MANQHRLGNWSTEDNSPAHDARSLRYMLGINSADNRASSVSSSPPRSLQGLTLNMIPTLETGVRPASPAAGYNISYLPFDNITTTTVPTTTTGRRWWNQPILNEAVDVGARTSNPTSFLEDDDPISYDNSSHNNFFTRPLDMLSLLSYEEHPWMNFVRRRNDLSPASALRATGEEVGSSSRSRSSGQNDNNYNNNLDFPDTFLAPTNVPRRPGSSVPPPPPPSSPSPSDYLINPPPPQSEQYMQIDSTLASSENPARPSGNNGIFISTSEIRAERDRLMDEIQSTLQHLRNGGSIRSEDVMILNFLVTLNPLIDSENWSNQIITALEGHIGRVERGLTEEEILRCIHEETYQFNPNETSTQNQTCTICQEDFVDGESIGKLDCIHVYHLHCIKQWLELRNACPICKKTALEIDEDEDGN